MELRTEIDFNNERFLMFVMDEMANSYEREGKDVVRMTLGKSELPQHKGIISAIQDAAADYAKYSLVYPGGLPSLKDELSQYYKMRYSVNIKPENFIISTGTSTIFRNLFHLLTTKGDEVLIPMPYYSLYHFCALLTGATVRYYNIDTETMRVDFDSFRENFTDKTKIVVINSPGNPLGNILT